jgi:alkaline phosphatase
VLEFEAAVEVVRDFAAARDDTLVVVVSDHGCGGLALGNARAQADRRRGFSDGEMVAPLRGLRWSTQALWETHGIAGDVREETVRRVVEEHWGGALSEAQTAEVIASSRSPDRDEDFDGLGRVFSRDHTYLGWTTHEHTADDVPLFAWGPGAPAGRLHLTDVHRALATHLGLSTG